MHLLMNQSVSEMKLLNISAETNPFEQRKKTNFWSVFGQTYNFYRFSIYIYAIF